MYNQEKANKRVQECVGITLESNEELHMVIRKHWIVLFETCIFFVVLAGLCVGIYFVLAF